MSGSRTNKGGLIDRNRRLGFQFDGRHYNGFQGDTVASALLANGISVIGRSFKYHRPRGLWGAWFDDPNSPVNITVNTHEFPNCPATTTYLEEGMNIRSVNAWPSAKFDAKSALNWLRPFLPAGFYYKTFMWPDWHLFEPAIRKMAGLGNLDPEPVDQLQSDQIHQTCDVLIVGSGPAGLIAANAAVRDGQSVLLVDDHNKPGGSAYRFGHKLDDKTPQDWVNEQVRQFEEAGGQLLCSTTAFGIYDHNLVALAQFSSLDQAPRLWRIRAKRIILATGAIDRPITFTNNDKPGIMSLEGGLEYLARYGVLAGREIAILANHPRVEMASGQLQQAGANVDVFDASENIARAKGGRTLSAIRYGGSTYRCDALLVSGGLMPLVHLWRHAGGKLAWNEQLHGFVPDQGPQNINVIGAANGTFELEQLQAEAEAAASASPTPDRSKTYNVRSLVDDPHNKGSQWIDFQHDVTLKDIELAERENYASVEHLKRYTTLGMASDQGKTSNIPALEALAKLRDKSVPEVGTTTFRPPFVPVPFELYRGTRREQLFNPLKRLPLEPAHRSSGAALGEYGGWLRPGWYVDKDPEKAIHNEVIGARNHVAISDASPLGKIEVMGPDAGKFLNFVFYNNLTTLKPGSIRYALMLTERGTIFDDAVITRLEEHRYLVSCSSSHVDAVRDILEAWRQDGHDPGRIFIHDLTHNWVTITVSGPKSRQLLQELEPGVDLSAKAFPHMSFRQATFKQDPMRIARVSFTGDLSYELSVPVSSGAELWQQLVKAGEQYSAVLLGVEALSILRAEKGYIIVGKDTDGETMPHDIGFGIPRSRKKQPFVGDRSLHTHAANDDRRRHLIGLELPPKSEPLATGAHIIIRISGEPRSIGYVTSSYFSPTLDRPIALALMEQGDSLIGKMAEIWNEGDSQKAKIVNPCFHDPEGSSLNA